MTHGSLFNGIAGFPLAAARAGIPTVWTVEKDAYCNKVSKKHFPDAIQYEDIRDAKNLPSVDIISGGFPCQPFSTAGKRKGKEDDRFLWPEMLRIIREVAPAWVVAENVSGLISQDGGMVFEQVLIDLETENYSVQSFVLPAAGVGAWHRRDRVWIVAHSTLLIRKEKLSKINAREKQTFSSTSQTEGIAHNTNLSANGGLPTAWGQSEQRYVGSTSYEWKPDDFTSNASPNGLQNELQPIPNTRGTDSQRVCSKSAISDWWTSESKLRGVPDGLSAGLDKGRIKRLEALGNAIVPQVAYQIFKAIQTYESQL